MISLTYKEIMPIILRWKGHEKKNITPCAYLQGVILIIIRDSLDSNFFLLQVLSNSNCYKAEQ